MSKFNNVFVIDDDKIFHFIIKKLFSKSDINTTLSFYFNGLEAIEGLKEKINLGAELPDLILLDINMPIMDGWQFLEEFRKTKELTSQVLPIIYLVSSSDSNLDISKAKEFQDQVKDYFFKPISLVDLQKIF